MQNCFLWWAFVRFYKIKNSFFTSFGGHFDILKLINNWYKTKLTSLKKNSSEIRPFTITSSIFRNHSDFLFLPKVSGYLPNRVRFFQKVLSSSEQYFHGMNYRENSNFINFFFFSFFLLIFQKNLKLVIFHVIMTTVSHLTLSEYVLRIKIEDEWVFRCERTSVPLCEVSLNPSLLIFFFTWAVVTKLVSIRLQSIMS